MRHSFRLGLALLGLAVGTGCAQQTEVIRIHEDADLQGRSFSRFVVAEMSPSGVDRRQFEHIVAAALRAESVAAVARTADQADAARLTREALQEAARSADAEVVLLTRIASVETETTMREGKVEVLAECRQGDIYDPFLYDYDEIRSPDTIEISHTVTVIASLYDPGDGRRLWTIQSTCFDRQSREEFMIEEAQTIVRHLRRDGLLASGSSD